MNESKNNAEFLERLEQAAQALVDHPNQASADKALELLDAMKIVVHRLDDCLKDGVITDPYKLIERFDAMKAPKTAENEEAVFVAAMTNSVKPALKKSEEIFYSEAYQQAVPRDVATKIRNLCTFIIRRIPLMREEEHAAGV